MPRIADLDRGDIPVPVGKKPEMLDPKDKDERDRSRDGLRDLDRMVEDLADLSRFRRDEERALPRDGTGEVRHRRRPADDEPRRLTAYRQKMLNKQKTALDRDRVPVRARRAFASVFNDDPSELARINDLLAAHVGDVDALEDKAARTVRRVDRVIRMAEGHNVADNIVYTPIRPPDAVNSGNVRDWLNRNFAAGTEVNFDRYTITSHHAAQADGGGPADWRPLCEIVTRRGAYVGKAPISDGPHPNGAHYLPRGLRLRCVGIASVPITRPDGTQYRRTVLQLEDLT